METPTKSTVLSFEMGKKASDYQSPVKRRLEKASEKAPLDAGALEKKMAAAEKRREAILNEKAQMGKEMQLPVTQRTPPKRTRPVTRSENAKNNAALPLVWTTAKPIEVEIKNPSSAKKSSPTKQRLEASWRDYALKSPSKQALEERMKGAEQRRNSLLNSQKAKARDLQKPVRERKMRVAAKSKKSAAAAPTSTEPLAPVWNQCAFEVDVKDASKANMKSPVKQRLEKSMKAKASTSPSAYEQAKTLIDKQKKADALRGKELNAKVEKAKDMQVMAQNRKSPQKAAKKNLADAFDDAADANVDE